MSIYSGFATRNLENAYNKNVSNLIYLLQMHLSVLLKKGNSYKENVNTASWLKSYSKTIHSMVKLETQKHLETKFSKYCDELNEYFGVLSVN